MAVLPPAGARLRGYHRTPLHFHACYMAVLPPAGTRLRGYHWTVPFRWPFNLRPGRACEDTVGCRCIAGLTQAGTKLRGYHWMPLHGQFTAGRCEDTSITLDAVAWSVFRRVYIYCYIICYYMLYVIVSYYIFLIL